ncbi:MAG: glycoside hydrolase family 13 protein [Lachnospiraceae bacterium]|nr:glycoside hydrolase family 13 protein [Lachnospiraceae bacterium]
MDFNTSMYFSAAKPILDKGALFHDDSPDYIVPYEPAPYSEVSIRFRTGKANVDHVYIVINGEHQLMDKAETIGSFDYYEYTTYVSDELIMYYFEITSGNIKAYFNVLGVDKRVNTDFSFKLRPGYKTPDWIKGAVMYQIYVDRFCNGDKSNDVETGEYYYIGDKTVKVDDWNKYPALMGVREFYGGDLQGVLDKMDYLEDLGIEAIYFNPLFVSPSNHKYDIQDYDYIDPHFGKIVDEKGDLLQEGQTENRFATKYINRVTNKKNLEASNELFIKVVEEAHKRGIKVIIDGVFNHCGSFNKWLDRERIYENSEGYEKGAYVSKDSPYRKYFHFFDENESKWPYNGTYDGWWGHDTLPKLNYEGSQDLYNYILYIGKKWVSPPYNVDGWRLDVAADLGHSPEFNHKFWKDFRRVVKEANPNAVIIAEHYGDPWSWLQGDEWDTIMNYDAFMEPLTWFLTGMQKHSDDYRQDMLGNADNFIGAMRNAKTKIMSPGKYTSMNELSNHDHSRFLTRTNHVVGRVADKGPEAANNGINKAVMREAVVMQMTWVGAPTIYYGDEAGVCGFTDPDNRRTYPWGHEDQELIKFHKDIIKIHKENKELKTGSTKFLYKDYNVIAYGRFTIDSQSVIIVNNNDCEKEVNIKVLDIGIDRDTQLKQLIFTYEEDYSVSPNMYPVIGGKLRIFMPKHSSVILKAVKVDC